MNFLLLMFLLASVVNCVVGAPAVSSVHVRFVSGNKATQYSHGSLPDGSEQYNAVGSMEGHTVRKRSATQRPPREPGRFRRLVPRTTTTTTATMTTGPTEFETQTPTERITSDDILRIIRTQKPGELRLRNKILDSKGKKRVKLVVPAPTVAGEEEKSIVASSSESGTTTDSLLHSSDDMSSNSPKPKDSKAVKRSPYLSENFVGSFNFPDFDEFGGNDFGSLSNFGPSSGGSSQATGHSTMNAESLAPEGVFLPPIPTQASNYIENDPYLSDPETAKYASQHPPYFHEFPHKRTVLSLNERREENGLEPNILRSIRPFFAFFEINKRR